MSNATVQFFSEALGKWTRYNVILPEEGGGRREGRTEVGGRVFRPGMGA